MDSLKALSTRRNSRRFRIYVKEEAFGEGGVVPCWLPELRYWWPVQYHFGVGCRRNVGFSITSAL